MKDIFLLFTLIIAFAACNSTAHPFTQNDQENFRYGWSDFEGCSLLDSGFCPMTLPVLHGDVESVRLVLPYYYGYLEFIFNTNGDVVERGYYFQGEAMQKWSFEYDIKNRLKSLEDCWCFAGGSPVYKTVFTYDSNGKLAKNICYNPDGTTSESAYVYDAKGNLIKCGSATYEYDSHGRKISAYGGEFTWKYDSRGNLVEEICPDEYCGINKYMYEYDSYGRRSKMYRYFKEDPSDYWDFVGTETYIYDNEGRLVESNSKRYKYDSHGNVVWYGENNFDQSDSDETYIITYRK